MTDSAAEVSSACSPRSCRCLWEQPDSEFMGPRPKTPYRTRQTPTLLLGCAASQPLAAGKTRDTKTPSAGPRPERQFPLSQAVLGRQTSSSGHGKARRSFPGLLSGGLHSRPCGQVQRLLPPTHRTSVTEQAKRHHQAVARKSLFSYFRSSAPPPAPVRVGLIPRHSAREAPGKLECGTEGGKTWNPPTAKSRSRVLLEWQPGAGTTAGG